MHAHPLENEIRQLYRSDPDTADSAIERFIDERFIGLPESEKMSQLTALASHFASTDHSEPSDTGIEETVFSGIFSLLLGREISNENLASKELLERLSEALNTVFGTLNRIIQNINVTLLGGDSAEQTIRHVIGSRLQGEAEAVSLETYLGRIDKAFMMSHQAFRQAAHTLVLKILREIDPEKISAESGQKLKFGPMKKAEYFDLYRNKYETLKKWFESGRFMEDFLREFENSCHRNRP